MNKPIYTLTVTEGGFDETLTVEGKTYTSKQKLNDDGTFNGDVELGKLLAADKFKDRSLLMEIMLTARQAKMLCTQIKEATL